MFTNEGSTLGAWNLIQCNLIAPCQNMLHAFRALIRDLRSIRCKYIELKYRLAVFTYGKQHWVLWEWNAKINKKRFVAREYFLQSLYIYTVSFVWINSLVVNYVYERLSIESIYLYMSYYYMKNKINQFNFWVSVYHGISKCAVALCVVNKWYAIFTPVNMFKYTDIHDCFYEICYLQSISKNQHINSLRHMISKSYRYSINPLQSVNYRFMINRAE